jgi:hypothetical protein
MNRMNRSHSNWLRMVYLASMAWGVGVNWWDGKVGGAWKKKEKPDHAAARSPTWGFPFTNLAFTSVVLSSPSSSIMKRPWVGGGTTAAVIGWWGRMAHVDGRSSCCAASTRSPSW